MKTDFNYKDIRKDYEWDSDIMCEEDERVNRVKEIIDTRLSLPDKTIILLYVHCQSYRKLGARLGVSHMSVRKEVMRIRKFILEEYGKSSH